MKAESGVTAGRSSDGIVIASIVDKRWMTDVNAAIYLACIWRVSSYVYNIII